MRQVSRDFHLKEAILRRLDRRGRIEDAIGDVLKLLCEGLSWDLAEFWQMGDDAALHCTRSWCRERGDAAILADETDQRRLPATRGVPGRAWTTKRPVWITDVTSERDLFLRSDQARLLGLHSASAFPVMGSGGRVVGVMVFMSHLPKPPDLGALEVLEASTTALGRLDAQAV